MFTQRHRRMALGASSESSCFHEKNISMVRGHDHDCQIPITRDDALYLSGNSFLQKWFVALHRFITVSDKNPATNIYLRSRGSLTFQKRRHLRHNKYIIHPFSLFRHFWSLFIILILIILILTVPYQAAFDMYRETWCWTKTKNVLLSFCIADIIVNFTTGYFDEEQCIVEMHLKKIAYRYIFHGTFIFDLSGSLFTDLCFITNWNVWIVAREVASLTCILRMFSLKKYLKYVARVSSLPQVIYKFGCIVFWISIVIHLLTCLTWMSPIVSVSLKLPQRPKNESWVHEAKLWEEEHREDRYIRCFLRTVALFLRSGYLHSQPKTPEDLNFVVICQVVGTLSTWLLIARFMQYFKGHNSAKLRYQSTIAQLSQYMRYKHLPYPTQNRIISYYEFKYQYNYFVEREILLTLSLQLRQEISMYSCRKLVENVTFLNNLPVSILARIVALLKSEIYLTNDVIVRAKHIGDDMYFIASGTVAVYTPTVKEVCHLEDGAHFGEIALVMPNAKRIASVVAVEICEIYKLSRNNFVRTIHPYPMLWDRIRNIALERHEKTMILSAQ